MGRRRVAVLFLLCFVSPAFAIRAPRRLVWEGTLTSASGTATFRARTHVIVGRDIPMTYKGRLRCRGTACPVRRGYIDLHPRGDFVNLGRIEAVQLGGRRPAAIYCVCNPGEDDPDPLEYPSVDGPYTCWNVAPPQRPPFPIVAEGTLHLDSHRPPNPR